jgi:2-hydroxychromene-2-carboxylate isomerase
LVIEGGRTFLAGGRVPIIAEYNLQAIVDAGLTPRRYLSLFEDLGYASHLMKRPLWGNYRWADLSRIRGVGHLPELCNLVMLRAD